MGYSLLILLYNTAHPSPVFISSQVSGRDVSTLEPAFTELTKIRICG